MYTDIAAKHRKKSGENSRSGENSKNILEYSEKLTENSKGGTPQLTRKFWKTLEKSRALFLHGKELAPSKVRPTLSGFHNLLI